MVKEPQPGQKSGGSGRASKVTGSLILRHGSWATRPSWIKVYKWEEGELSFDTFLGLSFPN